MKSKLLIIRYCSYLVALIYVVFLYIDASAFNLGDSFSVHLKYLAIVILFGMSMFIGSEGLDRRDRVLVQAARFFTLIADYYLVIVNNVEYGILAFCLVQMLYIARHKFMKKIKVHMLLGIILLSIMFILLVINIDAKNLSKELVILGAVYGTLLVTSLYSAIKTRRYLIAIGMFLFFMCDLNVALFNLIGSFSFYSVRLEFIVGFLIWLFYLPSQLLLTLSGFNPEFLKQLLKDKKTLSIYTIIEKKQIGKGHLYMKSVHYNVEGLANSQSKTKVLNALDKLEGVQKVAVDLARGTVEVEFNEPASDESIKRCIENTGYGIE